MFTGVNNKEKTNDTASCLKQQWAHAPLDSSIIGSHLIKFKSLSEYQMYLHKFDIRLTVYC